MDSRLNDLDRLAHLPTENREYQDAAQQYAYLLRFKADSAVLHNNLGNVFYAQRRCTEASGEYREALRLQSDLPDAHHNLANCLLVIQKADEAIAEYLQTLELDPTRNDSRAMLGMALTHSQFYNYGNYPGARGGDPARAIRAAPAAAMAACTLFAPITG